MNIQEEQKQLVLARFKTLNPEAKLSVGGAREVSVREIIEHIEKGDDFGKQVIQVQMNMLKILSGAQ